MILTITNFCIEIKNNEGRNKTDSKPQAKAVVVPKLRNLTSTNLEKSNSQKQYSFISLSVRGIKEKVMRESLNGAGSQKSLTSRTDGKSSNPNSSNSVYERILSNEKRRQIYLSRNEKSKLSQGKAQTERKIKFNVCSYKPKHTTNNNLQKVVNYIEKCESQKKLESNSRLIVSFDFFI